MKKIITGLAIAFYLNINAQYVTIPDASFVTYLQGIVPSAMNGNLMDTTNAVVTTTTHTINVNHALYTDIFGVQFFKSLTYLDCSYNNLT